MVVKQYGNLGYIVIDGNIDTDAHGARLLAKWLLQAADDIEWTENKGSKYEGTVIVKADPAMHVTVSSEVIHEKEDSIFFPRRQSCTNH
jgi:hypothetical protein